MKYFQKLEKKIKNTDNINFSQWAKDGKIVQVAPLFQRLKIHKPILNF